jgi:hypothetical protein
MHPVYLIITILLTGFFALFKYLYGLFKTPIGSVFLGTVHHSTDYFIYLSEFAQGQERWFMSYVLQSQDVPNPSLIRFPNIFFGRIFYLLGLNPIESYTATVLLLIIFLVILTYTLLNSILPTKITALTLILFLTGNTFWTATHTPSGWQYSTTDFWYNPGNAFNRIISIPHHLSGQIAIEIIILVTIWWSQKNISVKRKIFLLLVSAISGIVIGGINAIHLILTAGILGISTILWFIFLKPFNLKRTTRQIFYSFIPILASLFGGAPIILHLKQVLSVPPYSQMISWEAYHQLYLSYNQFFIGFGPIMFIAPLGLILFLKNRSYPKLIAVIFTISCIFIYFSHIPERLMLGKVRFLPPILYLFICCFAASGINKIIAVVPRIKKLVIIFIGSLYIILTIPTFLIQLKTITDQYRDPTNAYFFLPKPFINVMNKARDISTINDTFLIPWPYAAPFPAITGRRVYFSEPLLANNANTKLFLHNYFFSGNMNVVDQKKFLSDNQIKYIICFTSLITPDLAQNLIKIDEQSGMGLWKVQQ